MVDFGFFNEFVFLSEDYLVLGILYGIKGIWGWEFLWKLGVLSGNCYMDFWVL